MEKAENQRSFDIFRGREVTGMKWVKKNSAKTTLNARDTGRISEIAINNFRYSVQIPCCLCD